MRTKTLALIAVSAVALVGCSAGDPSVEPTTTVTVTASPESVGGPTPTDLPQGVEAHEDPTKTVGFAEESFVTTAKIRSKSLEVVEPAKDDVITSLHEFCEDGAPINLSPTKEFNEVMETIATNATCDQLNGATN